jgi:hypothetical protein
MGGNLIIACKYTCSVMHFPENLTTANRDQLCKVFTSQHGITYQRTWTFGDLGLHCSLNEIFTLLRSYMAQIGSKLPMFWDNLRVPLSWVKQSKELDCLTLEDVTNRLSQKSVIYYQSMLHKIPEEQRPSLATSSTPL